MHKRNLPPLFAEVAPYDNVVGVGYGHKYIRGENTGKDSIVVLVKKKHNTRDLRRDAQIPKMLRGMPTDVIEVGDIRLLAERKERLRPAQPGLSISHYKVSAGTFGAVVRDKATGDLLILSNNHVLANLTDGTDGRATIGDKILQPGLYDGGKITEDVIGALERFVPLYKTQIAPKCKIAKLFEGILNKCIGIFEPQYRVQVLRESEQINTVDCAVARPDNPDLINGDILDFGVVTGLKEPQVGMTVKKSGRSTGVTYSIILATDVTMRVELGERQAAVFTDQILAGPMSMPGDSGSLVLTEDNYAVGLLFAGSEQATMFNKINNVLDSLNITL